MNKGITKVLYLVDSDIHITFTHMVADDICNNGHITIWVYDGNKLITSFWLNSYEFKFWFKSKENRLFFSLKKAEVK